MAVCLGGNRIRVCLRGAMGGGGGARDGDKGGGLWGHSVCLLETWRKTVNAAHTVKNTTEHNIWSTETMEQSEHTLLVSVKTEILKHKPSGVTPVCSPVGP